MNDELNLMNIRSGKVNSILIEFKDKYKDLPGVMDIILDDWFSLYYILF